MWTGRLVACALAMSVAFVSPIAQADDIRASPAERETARKLMDQGVAYRDRGDYASALRSFQAADAIMNVPTTGFEIARTALEMGRLLEAQRVALRVAALPASPTEPAPFKEAREKARALARELDTRIPTLEVELHGFAPDTVVTVDGVPLDPKGRTRIDLGPHQLSAGSGAQAVVQRIVAVEGEIKRVTLTARPTQGWSPPLEKKSGAPVLVIGGFSLSIIGAATGTVAGVLALSKRSDLGDRCPDDRCPRSVYSSRDFRDDLDTGRTMATMSTIGFVAAGVGLAVAVVGLALPSRSNAQIAISDRAVLGGTF